MITWRECVVFYSCDIANFFLILLFFLLSNNIPAYEVLSLIEIFVVFFPDLHLEVLAFCFLPIIISALFEKLWTRRLDPQTAIKSKTSEWMILMALGDPNLQRQ